MEVLDRLVKKDIQLTERQREDYGSAFAYIEKRALEVKSLTDNAVEFNENLKDMHRACLSLHKRVDTANRSYQRLNTAIARLGKTMAAMDEFAKETEAAWGKLAEVEKKLFELPFYASGKSQNLDEMLFGQ